MDSYRETFDTWNSVAALYDEKFGNLSIYDDGLAYFADHVTRENAHLLDMACGPGNITKFLAHKFPSATIDAFDIAPKMLALAKSNIPTANFEFRDIRSISTITKKYNAISCGFCIPYLSEKDLSKLFSDAKNLLDVDGIFYISFINGDIADSGFKTASIGGRMYMYFYSIDFIQNLLRKHHFEILKLFEYDYDRLEYIEKHVLLIAKRKIEQ